MEELQQQWLFFYKAEKEAQQNKIEIENKILALDEKPTLLKIAKSTKVEWEQDKLQEIIEKHNIEDLFDTKIEYKAKKELFDENKNLSCSLPEDIREDLSQILTIKEGKPSFSMK